MVDEAGDGGRIAVEDGGDTDSGAICYSTWTESSRSPLRHHPRYAAMPETDLAESKS